MPNDANVALFTENAGLAAIARPLQAFACTLDTLSLWVYLLQLQYLSEFEGVENQLARRVQQRNYILVNNIHFFNNYAVW